MLLLRSYHSFKSLRYSVELENRKWRCGQMTQQKKKREENQEKEETEYNKFMKNFLQYECVKE
jgi:hypothetical protein